MQLQKLFVIFLAHAACCLARELGGAGTAERRPVNSVQHVTADRTMSYEAALSNSSCHGFLLGIGTQKGMHQFMLWLAEQPNVNSCHGIIGITIDKCPEASRTLKLLSSSVGLNIPAFLKCIAGCLGSSTLLMLINSAHPRPDIQGAFQKPLCLASTYNCTAV